MTARNRSSLLILPRRHHSLADSNSAKNLENPDNISKLHNGSKTESKTAVYGAILMSLKTADRDDLIMLNKFSAE